MVHGKACVNDILRWDCEGHRATRHTRRAGIGPFCTPPTVTIVSGDYWTNRQDMR